jgi:polyhydroxyalkanoate synthesis regulator phasin
MNFLGESILSLQSSDPATLAAIVALQAEVAVIDGEITFLQTEAKTQEGKITTVQGQISSLQNDVKDQEGELTAVRTRVTALEGAVVTLQDDEKKIKDSVTQIQTQLTTLSTIIQNAPSIADCGSLVLTCPVTMDTATLRVAIAADWDTFYSTGYSPPASPFTLTQFVSVNFQTLEGFNPIGLYWTRPSGVTSATATFEIDATASFIASIDLGVRIGVQGLNNIFDTTPLYYVGYNEQRYRPSANVSSWSARVLVTVPLRDAQNVQANIIVFQVEARTIIGGAQQFVYGIGENFANQHHLIVRRIQ